MCFKYYQIRICLRKYLNVHFHFAGEFFLKNLLKKKKAEVTIAD